MALTESEHKQLVMHWGLVIQTIHPGITETPKGDDDSIGTLLETWRPITSNFPWVKPSAVQIEDALLNTVIPTVEAEEQTEAADVTNSADARARLKASALADRTPEEIYTLMQGQIDGWTSLADAQADLREWLPLMAAAVVWRVKK